MQSPCEIATICADSVNSPFRLNLNLSLSQEKTNKQTDKLEVIRLTGTAVITKYLQ